MSLPPKPNFRTPSSEVRAELFGTFKYQPIGNGNIRILGGWAEQNIIRVTVPQIAGIEGCNATGSVYFHRKGAAQLQGFFEEVERQGLKHLLLSWGGSFVPRFIRGSNRSLSNHAFGSAFDINAAWNGLNRPPMAEGKKGSVIPLVKIANDFGFYWGGHYASRPDGMHFELAALNRFPKSFGALSSADEPEEETTPENVGAVIDAQTIQPSPVASPLEPTPVEQQAEHVNDNSSNSGQNPSEQPATTSIFGLDRLNELGQKAGDGADKVENIQAQVGKISKSSLFEYLSGKIIALFLGAASFFSEHWLELLIAAVAIMIATMVYAHFSKGRAHERWMAIWGK